MPQSLTVGHDRYRPPDCAGLSQQSPDGSTSHAAQSDYAIIDANSATAAKPRDAVRISPEGDSFERRLSLSA